MRQLLKFSLLVFLLLIQVLPAFSQSKKFRTDSLRVDNGMLFGATNVTPILSNFDGSFLNSSVINFANGDRLGFVNKYSDDLAATVSALSSGGLIVVIDTVDVTTNVTLSDDMRIAFWSKGILNITSGDTVNIPRNAIDAKPDQRIFMGSGEVRTPGSHLHAKWFGVVADGVNEDAIPLQKASDALRLESDAVIPHGRVGVLELPRGTLELNPASRMVFLPDSGKTVRVFGASGYSTKIHNTDYTTAEDLLTDTPVLANYRHGGTLHWHDVEVDGSKRLESDAQNEVNVFGIVVSNAIFERIRVLNSGARAFAFEGLDDVAKTGFQNIYMNDIYVKNTFANAISINKHSATLISSIVLQNILVDGFSMAVPDSFTSTGYPAVQILGRSGADNPGHKITLSNITVINGNWGGLFVNGPDSRNNFSSDQLTVRDIDLTYFTSGAAVLISNLEEGQFSNTVIRNITGGTGWRDRTGDGNKLLTNVTIDSCDGFGMDLFGTTGYRLVNANIRDNDDGQFFMNESNGWPWLTLINSHVRGDTLLTYTTPLEIRDKFDIQGSKIELLKSYSAGDNIVDNWYWARDSVFSVRDENNDGVPDGWEIVCQEGYRDSVRTFLHPDSGLIMQNLSSANINFFIRQYLGDRVEDATTYEVQVYTLAYKSGSTGRVLINAGTDLGLVTAGAYTYTGKTFTGGSEFIGFGRTGATNLFAGSRQVIKWLRVLKE